MPHIKITVLVTKLFDSVFSVKSLPNQLIELLIGHIVNQLLIFALDRNMKSAFDVE